MEEEVRFDRGRGEMVQADKIWGREQDVMVRVSFLDLRVSESRAGEEEERSF